MASIEPNKTTKLNELKINLVDTKATFQAMQQAKVVESNQLYFIEEKDVGSTVEYIVGTQTASTGSWTGVTKDSELTVGKVIAYKLPYAGSGNASLTLTFTNPTGNNTSGAIPVYLNNTQVTTHYAAKSVILMVYDGTNWRSTDYWNSNSRDAGYGKISITQSDAVTAIKPNTNQLEATTYNEKMTVTAGNKWIKLAGTNGASNADVLTIGHSVSGVTAGDYGDSTNQTPTYGKTFQVPYISVDAGGHITSISTHTVKIPASDNTNTATAADNILDGSNSGTQITYAPYDTQQNKLSFDTSDTAPTRTDKLNLNGYLYATKLYSGGNEVLTAHQTLPTATTSQKGLVQIGSGITVNDGTISVTAANLGLSNAMHFIGVAKVAITDGSTTDPQITGYSTKTAGDVIIDKDSSYEYVWSSANKWERLGGDSSYKTTQSVVNSPSAKESTTAFIDTISQNANGVITATKKNLDTSGTWSGNAGSATKLQTARSLTTKLNSTTAVTFDGSADQNTIPVTGILPIANGGTGTNTLTSGEALIGNGTSAITTRAITNNTTATVAAKTNNLITNNTLYYATASINNARQTNNVSIYAPTTAGTANQILVSKGGTSAPDWKATANGAAYATTTNGVLTFGTLPVAQGGTGVTSIANIQAGKDGDGKTISSTYLKLSGGTMTGTIKRAGAGGNWQSGRDRALICMNSLNSYSTLASMKTDNGSWDIGAYSSQSYTDDLIFSYIKDTTYSGTNGTDAQIRFLEDSGVQANKFVVTSVSYGDKNHRPTNPDIGQLYFQFID